MEKSIFDVITDYAVNEGVNAAIDYFTPRDPERNPVPLHWFSFANHRFAFGIHPYVLFF